MKRLAVILIVSVIAIPIGFRMLANYHVEQAQLHLLAWINDRAPLFDPEFARQEKRVRDALSTGVATVTLGDRDWDAANFVVTSKDGKRVNVFVYRRGGGWRAQSP